MFVNHDSQSASVIFLGNASRDSAEVNDYLANYKSYTLGAKAPSLKQASDQSRFVYVLINEDTDIEKIELLNDRLQSLQSNDRFMIILEKSCGARLTSSLYSRLVGDMKEVPAIDTSHMEDFNVSTYQKSVDVRVSLRNLKRTCSISEESSETIGFREGLSTFLEDVYADLDNSEAVLLTINVPEDEYTVSNQLLIDLLNRFRKESLYSLSIENYPNLTLCLKKEDSLGIEDRITQSATFTSQLYVGYPSKEDSPLLITDINVSKLKAQLRVTRSESELSQAAWTETPYHGTCIYVNTLCSEQLFHLLLDWLAEDKKRSCYFANESCVSSLTLDPTFFGL